MSVSTHYHASRRARREVGLALPCANCRHLLNEHIWLTFTELDQYTVEGYDLRICYSEETHEVFRILCYTEATPPPDNPCDGAFMEDIST